MFEYDYERFDKFVENNKIPKNKLVFEISEDINLGVISEETLSYITEKGYDLAIDDFGSGVSKLTDVLSGKLQSIKTDKGMLPLCKKDTKNVKAFSTIIKAVNASGSKVCVEGVETTEQLEIIIKAGSTSAQGYLFAKPLSYDELIDFIRTFDFDKYQK
jgi:EAL domain-containing protein (putative c-di-GMP-specific phosphodiesterase class I)